MEYRTVGFQCKEQNGQYFHRDCFPTIKVFLETFIEEIKPIVKGDKGWWVWISRKIFDKRFFFEILDYPVSAATNKINVFSPQNYFRSVMFYTEFLMEEFELVVAEEYKFEIWAKWRKVTLCAIFGLSRLWCREHKSTILASEIFSQLESLRCWPCWKRESL